MKPITLFRGTTGLNNVVDPLRVKFDPESGICDLAEAYNVDIDISGRISRRKGLTATEQTDASHSLFCDGGDCFFIKGNSLFRLNRDYTRTGIRTELTVGARMSFCQITNRTYYANGSEKGYVENGVSYAWVAEPYTGPISTKVISSPPLGHLLAAHSSRIYVAMKDGIEYSEPFAYSWFARASNFIPFKSRPRMLRAVDDGLFVGLDNGVVFLRGRSPSEFEYAVVSTSPVVEGTDCKSQGDRFDYGGKFVPEKSNTFAAVMWTAQDGIYAGMHNGEVKNLTKERLVYEGSQIGCAVFKDNKYITLLR